MTIKDNKGFTLVEVVVIAILMVILAGAGMAFFIVFTREKAQASAYMVAQMQSEIFVEEVARKTRESNYLLPGPDATSTPELLTETLTNTYGSDTPFGVDTVFFYRHGEDAPWAGFCIADTTVEIISKGVKKNITKHKIKEYVNGNFEDFVSVGNKRFIEIGRAPDDAPKAFYIKTGSLPEDHLRQIEINLTIRSGYEDDYDDDEFYALKVERGVFVCRIF